MTRAWSPLRAAFRMALAIGAVGLVWFAWSVLTLMDGFHEQ